MSAFDFVYIAIAIAFFLLIDWIVGLIDERNVDARR